MKKNQPVDELNRRYRRLARTLAAPGRLLQGTITAREMLRPDPQAPDRKKTYGPYYQWTFKQKGKTTTVNLTSTQAKLYQKAINNHRRLEKTIQEMRTLSRQIYEQTTTGVKKRKRQII